MSYTSYSSNRLLGLVVAVAGCLQIDYAQSQRISISPFSTSRSVDYTLRSGDLLSVVSESSDAGFALDLYVYDSNDRLAGKDDEDVTNNSFIWKAQRAGRFHVVARNASGAAGYWKISVSNAKGATKLAAHEENRAIGRIFYATDRATTGDRRPNYMFGSEPNNDIQFGSCEISIPRGHKMGELEGPSILRLEFSEDAQRHVVLQSVGAEDAAQFYKDVARRTQRSSRKEAFVFIPGFNSTFAESARRTAQLAYDLGFDGAPILYSWPSQGVASVSGYNKDARNAELSTSNLKKFLGELVRTSGTETIHLIAHSMGNRPLSTALKQVAHEQTEGIKPIFKQVVLMAPDIDAELFRQLAKEISNTADRVTLYASSKDEALVLSNRYAGYPRAGQGGKDVVVVAGIETVDASDVDTNALGLFHQYYADNKTILSDLFNLMRGDAAANRFGLAKVNRKEGAYWVFRTAAR